MNQACIAHKSLEICERCRLQQRNPPAPPDDSPALRRDLIESMCRFIHSITGSKTDGKRLFLGYLARNTGVAANFARFLRARRPLALPFKR
jgi:hypothetical protein